MNVTKRDGRVVSLDKEKIKKAVLSAFKEVDNEETTYARDKARDIANYIESLDRDMTVEEIQDIVEDKLMASNRKDVARSYVRFRYKKEMARNTSSMFDSVLELIEGENDELNVENSNKNPTIASTQRDYMAGEVSKYLVNSYFLPEDIAKAHKEGIIHFHDADYFAQKIYNCCLWDLDDILQNGSMISNTKIETPHSFSTACNIATQFTAQIASSQYGGQTFTLTALAKFVDVSRQRFRKEVEKEFGNLVSKEKIDEVVENMVKEEINRGVQTLQYQILTLMTTNGQTPFVSVFMYLNEAKDEQTKKDLALVIEEVLKQRIQGVKNEKGVYVTPTFPKLLYVLEEDNITEDSEYWYLTKLAAQCTAKRMVPDYISEKIMLELKGDCYPCINKTCA